MTLIMISDNITPEIRERFSREIKESKLTNTERGFYMCIEENGKLSAGKTCTGEHCGIQFSELIDPCKGKKIQGDFHTHPYLAQIKKEFGLKNPSKELMRSSINKFLKERNITPTTISQGDGIGTILGKCSNKTEGTTCIGSDIDEKLVECWTLKQINDIDCMRALTHRASAGYKGSIPPKDWILSLFNKEMIKLTKVINITDD